MKNPHIVDLHWLVFRLAAAAHVAERRLAERPFTVAESAWFARPVEPR